MIQGLMGSNLTAFWMSGLLIPSLRLSLVCLWEKAVLSHPGQLMTIAACQNIGYPVNRWLRLLVQLSLNRTDSKQDRKMLVHLRQQLFWDMRVICFFMFVVMVTLLSLHHL